MNNTDLLLFEEQLSDDELIILKSAREYCQSELMPRILEANRNEIFDKSIYKEMGKLGFLGAPIKGYGCAGTNYVSYGLIAREIESVDSSYRSAFSVQTSLAMHAIYKFGSDEQKEFYLPEMAKGNLIGCFGLTESEAGSDPASMRTLAVEKENGYELNGSKTWITNSPIADVLIIWAKDEQGVLRGFIARKEFKGLETKVLEGKFALRASTTGQIFMSDVFIPDDHVLPLAQSFKGPFSCLNMARYGIAWGAIGAAMDCYDTALRYSKERSQFGKPIGGFQLQQKKLAEMITEITKAQLLAWRLGTLKNEGKATSAQISMAKRNNVEMALKIAREARQILGGMGITGDYSIMRHMMNLESVITYEGTHDIHLLITGLDITGLNLSLIHI